MLVVCAAAGLDEATAPDDWILAMDVADDEGVEGLAATDAVPVEAAFDCREGALPVSIMIADDC